MLNYKGIKNLEFAFRNAGKLEPGVIKKIKKVVYECNIYRKNSRSRSRPNVTVPRTYEFNSVVSLDLKEFGKM